jgi:hypothetical protein
VNDGRIFKKFYTWYVEDVGVLHEKNVSNVDFHAFQPFYSPLQMHVVTRANPLNLTTNSIFPNREVLEILKKFVSKRKSMSGQVPNFQNRSRVVIKDNP